MGQVATPKAQPSQLIPLPASLPKLSAHRWGRVAENFPHALAHPLGPSRLDNP